MTETLTTPTSAPVHASRATRLLRGLGSVLVPLVVLGSATGILVASTHPESWTVDHAIQTEDAQLRADITPLSTKSTGVVAVVAVEDYQRVKAGDLLVLLKDDDFRAQVDLAEAAVRAARAALKNLQAQRATQGSRIGEAQAFSGAFMLIRSGLRREIRSRRSTRRDGDPRDGHMDLIHR
jgi:membrane fusion protein, multidrug efflux system